MNKYITIIFFITILISCKSEKKIAIINETETKTKVTITDDFELIKYNKESKAILILFGGFGEKPADIKREFKIVEIAKKNKISLLLMNYSNKLWLEEAEKRDLATLLQEIIEKHNLKTQDVYIGGFSSGGVVSVHISNYLLGNKEFKIIPKGVFIADSPIDLLALHEASKLNIEKQFSEVAVQESNWIIKMFEEKLGDPKNGISNYEKYAVYTLQSDYTKNLEHLKNTKIRLYTEPDLKWWKENRRTNYEQTNAYYIKNLSESLKKRNFKNVAYIPTKNKGYRANGERHPHSWAIIDAESLIDWILDTK
jgi:hypothetical protein